MSAARELHVELIVNRCVRATNGRVIGRIEEIRATSHSGAYYVSEYLIGAYALFERLAGWRIGRALLRTLRVRGKSYRVPWDKLDLSDPERPRLNCAVDELEPLVHETPPPRPGKRDPRAHA